MRVCVSASVKLCVCVCVGLPIFFCVERACAYQHMCESRSHFALSLSPSSSHLPTKHMGCTENNCRNRERAAQWEQTFEIKKKVRKEANKTPECEKKQQLRRFDKVYWSVRGSGEEVVNRRHILLMPISNCTRRIVGGSRAQILVNKTLEICVPRV